jgi:hypothetical protein
VGRTTTVLVFLEAIVLGTLDLSLTVQLRCRTDGNVWMHRYYHLRFRYSRGSFLSGAPLSIMARSRFYGVGPQRRLRRIGNLERLES